MISMRLTPQEIDPVGTITAASIVMIAAALAMSVSVVLTIAHWSEVGSPVAAVLAIALVAAAGIVAVIAAAPNRAPFTVERLSLVVALAVGAAIAEYVSTLGADRYLYDDFGPIVIGLLILSLAPFCTWFSLILAGVLAAAVSAILVIGAVAFTAIDAPIGSYIAVNSAAVLAMTAAAAGYSYAIVDETLAWQREANRAALRRDAELRVDIARSAQENRVSMLGREVLPFLAGVMTADRLSVTDTDRARELAEALGRALQEGIDSTWLDDAAARMRSMRGIAVVVDDADGAAADLTDDQRAALSALIAWLGDGGRSDAITLTVSNHSGAHRIGVVAVRTEAHAPRRDLDRFAAVCRAVGMQADVSVTRENVTVELHRVPN